MNPAIQWLLCARAIATETLSNYAGLKFTIRRCVITVKTANGKNRLMVPIEFLQTVKSNF